jgi:hypothetical protein
MKICQRLMTSTVKPLSFAAEVGEGCGGQVVALFGLAGGNGFH